MTSELIAFRALGIKGQIKPKADWRAIDSPKKQTNKQICFVCFFAFHNKQNKLFLGRIYGIPKLFSVLSDFYFLSIEN